MEDTAFMPVMTSIHATPTLAGPPSASPVMDMMPLRACMVRSNATSSRRGPFCP